MSNVESSSAKCTVEAGSGMTDVGVAAESLPLNCGIGGEKKSISIVMQLWREAAAIQVEEDSEAEAVSGMAVGVGTTTMVDANDRKL